MQVSVLPGNDLTPEHIAAWSAIQSANPALESPFFCPEFTLAVAQATDNVFVGVLQNPDGKVAGFFPFQLVRPGFGKNLDMCDYQGVIALPSVQWTAKDLIRGCGLKAWEFDHLLPSQETFRRFHCRTAESPIMDLSEGFKAYQASLNEDGKRQLGKLAVSARKVERELGPLRFVRNSSDLCVMQKMHEWRARKYGALPKWSHDALETMRKTSSETFAGILSALFAGDTLIAVHFGIRSRTVWHWWFPAYNPELPSRFAPGILLLLKMAECSADAGIKTIDLGKGAQAYKRKFQNHSAMVAEGAVELLSLATVTSILCRRSLKFIRNNPKLLNLARRAKRIFYKQRPSSA